MERLRVLDRLEGGRVILGTLGWMLGARDLGFERADFEGLEGELGRRKSISDLYFTNVSTMKFLVVMGVAKLKRFNSF